MVPPFQRRRYRFRLHMHPAKRRSVEGFERRTYVLQSLQRKMWTASSARNPIELLFQHFPSSSPSLPRSLQRLALLHRLLVSPAVLLERPTVVFGLVACAWGLNDVQPTRFRVKKYASRSGCTLSRWGNTRQSAPSLFHGDKSLASEHVNSAVFEHVSDWK